MEDLRQDKSIMAGDIICLQETGTYAIRPELEGYTFVNGGAGKNKGVAIYMRDEVYLNEPPKRVENEFIPTNMENRTLQKPLTKMGKMLN